MALFIKNNEKLTEAKMYIFEKETELQELLFNFPEIVLNISEIEIDSEEIAIKYREYSTSRGPIDVLYITKNANIVLIETKLIKNPESIRTVVAQTVDYIKALTVDGCEDIKNKSSKNIEISDNFTFDDKFMHLLNKNISTGNIIAIIIGDDIHPNLLGLIESIQSAPHLAFNISLVKIEAYENDNQLIITAKIVEKTNEVERSVIKITFDNNLIKPIIESETPAKDGKGTRPKLNWEDYINSVEEKYKKTIEKYKQEWIKYFGNTINMGTVGFTAGVIIGEKRLAPLWVYDNKIELITERGRSKMGISDKTYLVYKRELEKTPEIYDKYLVSGKQMVNFNDISIEALENIFNATIKYGIEIQNDYKK